MIEKLQEIIDNSKYLVFFGGAGVSTESGIKDFRSVDGLYNEKYDYPPEEILSHSFFINNTEEFYKFYRDKLNTLNIEPNITHKYLKTLENRGILKAIVTQNIDGLHEKAGSKKVLLLHGTTYQNFCMKCGKEYGPEIIFNKEEVPYCECGGLIKPNVVLYEEPLDESITTEAINHISKADTLIIAGTSLNVYPAASYIHYFHGKNLIIINRDNTSYDYIATMVIHDKLGNVFSKLK